MCSTTLGSAFLPVFSHMMDISVSIDSIISILQLTPAWGIPFSVLKRSVSNSIAKKIDVSDATMGYTLILTALVLESNPVRSLMESPISAITLIPRKPSLMNLGK